MRLHFSLIGMVLVLILVSCIGTNQTPSHYDNATIEIHFVVEGETQYFDVVGIPVSWTQSIEEQPLSDAEWRLVFAIFVEGGTQPMLGDYSTRQSTIRFAPAFPLIGGQTYHATFSPEVLIELWQASGRAISHQMTITEAFTIPQNTTPTIVTEIYPSADVLPSNLLRFYVYFSAPMREGNALEHIALMDADDNEIEDVFFDPIFELWDASKTRLTLLFDPGRVKTGLQAHISLGRALVPGEAYTLVIRDTMIDANGNHLDVTFEKSFMAVEPDLSPPDLAQWGVSSPLSGSHEPLILYFPDPLDHQLLVEFIQIRNVAGDVITGQIILIQEEMVWHFVPDTAWASGHYQLWVNTQLEDLAGNNLHGRFDIPPEERLLYVGQTELMISFQVE